MKNFFLISILQLATGAAFAQVTTRQSIEESQPGWYTVYHYTGAKESKKMDQLIDVLDDDATANFQIVKATHSNIQEYRRQLKIQAIKAAKEKGTYLTEAINEKLGEAITIVEPEENGIVNAV